jgi:short-subunit dehydrogenase
MLCGMSQTASSTPAPGTALVTGPTSGIGRAFADQLAARGHDLVLVARDEARLEAVAAELRDRYPVAVEVLPADLTDRGRLARVEERLADPARPVEVLVNNAGFGLKKPFLDNSLAAEQSLLDVHVVAPMRLTHVALSVMVPRGRGRIVNVASVAGFLPRGSYSAAKAYVIRLSQWAHAEYAGRGVTVMALCPGFVETEFHGRFGVSRDSAPRFLWLQADDLVREALADLDAGRAISVPSLRYKAIAGMARLVPSPVLQRFQSLGRK